MSSKLCCSTVNTLCNSHIYTSINQQIKTTQPKLVTGNGNLTTPWLCFYMNTNINDFSYQIHLSATLIILI